MSAPTRRERVQRLLDMRAAQGLPPKIEDPRALEVIAATLRQVNAAGGDRHEHRHAA